MPLTTADKIGIGVGVAVTTVVIIASRVKAAPPPFLEFSKDELYPYLLNGDVGKAWWDIPEEDRKELALRIINWWSVPMGQISWAKYLKPSGEWHQFQPMCVGNSCIRCGILGDSSLAEPGHYYQYPFDEWHELREEPCFHLPVASVSVIHHYDETIFGHAIAALQIDKNAYGFNSWIFFQYDEADIKPGYSWQMPIPGVAKLYWPTKFTISAFWGDKITELSYE